MHDRNRNWYVELANADKFLADALLSVDAMNKIFICRDSLTGVARHLEVYPGGKNEPRRDNYVKSDG